MMLCLDSGNTRLKWALMEDDQWTAGGALLPAELGQLASSVKAFPSPTRIIGCNVAGTARAQEIETALSGEVLWIAPVRQQCGVTNGYDAPEKLGADRWAALVGARALHRGDALVILAGTATTIDVLDAHGRHHGGLILPGLDMMAKALASGTADLPAAKGCYQPQPRNTHDAIVSGAIHATLGAIRRMFDTLAEKRGATCLVSGGAAEALLNQLDLPNRRIDNLVLEGLACIAAEPDPA